MYVWCYNCGRVASVCSSCTPTFSFHQQPQANSVKLFLDFADLLGTERLYCVLDVIFIMPYNGKRKQLQVTFFLSISTLLSANVHLQPLCSCVTAVYSILACYPAVLGPPPPISLSFPLSLSLSPSPSPSLSPSPVPPSIRP